MLCPRNASSAATLQLSCLGNNFSGSSLSLKSSGEACRRLKSFSFTSVCARVRLEIQSEKMREKCMVRRPFPVPLRDAATGK